MSAPIRIPALQAGHEGFPELRIPRRGWRRSHAAESSLRAEGQDARVFVCRIGGYRLTLSEAVDGKLSGTLTDERRAWILSDHSTLLAWMAAVQCLAH